MASGWTQSSPRAKGQRFPHQTPGGQDGWQEHGTEDDTEAPRGAGPDGEVPGCCPELTQGEGSGAQAQPAGGAAPQVPRSRGKTRGRGHCQGQWETGCRGEGAESPRVPDPGQGQARRAPHDQWQCHEGTETPSF